jgi:hypothetical protein
MHLYLLQYISSCPPTVSIQDDFYVPEKMNATETMEQREIQCDRCLLLCSG